MVWDKQAAAGLRGALKAEQDAGAARLSDAVAADARSSAEAKVLSSSLLLRNYGNTGPSRPHYGTYTTVKALAFMWKIRRPFELFPLRSKAEQDAGAVRLSDAVAADARSAAEAKVLSAYSFIDG